MHPCPPPPTPTMRTATAAPALRPSLHFGSVPIRLRNALRHDCSSAPAALDAEGSGQQSP